MSLEGRWRNMQHRNLLLALEDMGHQKVVRHGPSNKVTALVRNQARWAENITRAVAPIGFTAG